MTYTPKKTLKDNLDDLVVRKGQAVSFSFTNEELDASAHHRLYFTCENRLHHALKDEPWTDKIYMLIDDCLNPDMANRRRFALDLSTKKPQPFPRRALIQLLWPTFVDVATYGATDLFKFGIFAKANNLKIHKGGFLRLRLERWEKKNDVHPILSSGAPDEVHIIDIPEGNFDYTEFSKVVRIPDSTASLVMTVEGENYEGNVYFEEPYLLSSTGNNICPDFDLCIPKLEHFMWLGQNLSKKEWPEVDIRLNGKSVYSGEVFLRIHRYAPIEIEIPDEITLEKENELTITYNSDYHDTVPLSIREAMLLEKPKQNFHIVYCPETAVWGKELCVLIRTETDNVTLYCPSKDFTASTPLAFGKAGLYSARFSMKKFENRQTLTLSDGTLSESVEITKVITRGEDGVVIGSSDMIYIDNSDYSAMEDFLEWYYENEMGNLITIRPSYRWGGERAVNPAVWEKFCEIAEGMDTYYAHMMDGRDLPSLSANPSIAMLEGKNFLGKQDHERDGQVSYWPHPFSGIVPITNAYFALSQRLYRENPEITYEDYSGHNLRIYDNNHLALRRTVCERADMKEAYLCTISDLENLQRTCTRHTGPSVFFKYFYQSGYDWAGAETMYSCMEPLLAFTRGAAKAYGKTAIGVHHAVQWATYPHDTEERYRRFALALSTSYLNGVTEINTEEGFWHLESRFAYHHRFSEACREHRKPEKQLYRYIASHTRSGRFYTPIAFLHGRYDGWDGFDRTRIFGMTHMLIGEAELSWSLMRVFYPLSMPNDMNLRFPCESPLVDDKPRGCYSGTPRGSIDVLPVEAGDYSDYKLLSFVGYNSADKKDFDRLLDYVKKGGMLLGGWPHFSPTTDLEDIQSYRHTYLSHPLTNCLTDGAPEFSVQSYKGKPIPACVNLTNGGEVLERTDQGTPLVYSLSCGKGKIILVNCKFYPANEAIRPVYEKILCDLQAQFANDETTEIICGEDVQYTTYLQEDGTKHFYLTPVDWYNKPDFTRYASLRVGEDVLPISLSFGAIVKIVATDTIAAWCEEESAEVLSISEQAVTVQGVDTVTLHIFTGGKETIHTLNCSKKPTKTVSLS